MTDERAAASERSGQLGPRLDALFDVAPEQADAAAERWASQPRHVAKSRRDAEKFAYADGYLDGITQVRRALLEGGQTGPDVEPQEELK